MPIIETSNLTYTYPGATEPSIEEVCLNIKKGDFVILTGPSGTGKTLVAKAIHAELGNLDLIESNGVTINKKSELFSVLLNADSNTTVFIDEAQGMNSKSQHILLTALSEKKLYVPAGVSSANSHIITLERT